MKRVFCLIITFSLIVSMICVSSLTATCAQTELEEASSWQVISFDVNSAGWRNFSKVFCHVMAYDDYSLEWPSWQSPAEVCDYDKSTGVATYDLSKTGNTLEYGAIYTVIFSNENGVQTYSLLFDRSCIGDIAYCDGTEYENPQDSAKTSQAAFWYCQDPDKLGPEKCITSIGNVVGTCIPSTTTPQEMFENFLKDTLTNARTYARNEDGTKKTDQQILDDTASQLGLNKNDVAEALANTKVSTSWKKSKSYLPDSSYMKGDTDCDSDISILDALMIQKHLAEKIKLSGKNLKNADVDLDSSISIIDATRIQYFLAEKIDVL